MSKYTVEELSRFNDRLRNVLENDRCIEDFEKFLTGRKEERFAKAFEIWKGVTEAIKKGNGVQPETMELMNRADWIDEVTKHNLKLVQDLACIELEHVCGKFIDYLKELN